MSLGAAIGLGALYSLPALLLLAARYALLCSGMDARARRRYAVSALVFGAFSIACCGLLAAFRGELALPVFWELLLPALAAGLLVRQIRRT